MILYAEEYLSSEQIQIEPKGWATTPVRERILYMNSMKRIVQHFWSLIQLEMTEKLVPILDTGKKIRSTSDMPTWFTSKPNKVTQHSQISHAVFDSAWEDTESYALEKNPDVVAWAKNDHLGFTISYV